MIVLTSFVGNAMNDWGACGGKQKGKKQYRLQEMFTICVKSMYSKLFGSTCQKLCRC